MNDQLLALSRRARVPLILQEEEAECGLACLAMISAHYGGFIDLQELRSRFSVSTKGMTVTTLISVAEGLQLEARALRMEIADLSKVRMPVILHWELNHFVVLSSVRRNRTTLFEINDPASGLRRVGAEEFSQKFTGVVVEMAPMVGFSRRRQPPLLSISQLWTKAPGLSSALSQLVLLSAIVELGSLAAPFYLQIAIDSVLPSADLSFLTALALGFGGVALLTQFSNLVRSWSVIGLSNELGYRLVSNLFRHMTDLPASWFQKRSVGEVLTRFNATQPISDLLGGNMVPAIIDGVMALATVPLMLIYSPLLSALAVGSLALYTVIRLAYFGTLRARNIAIIQAQAREQSVLIETIRGIVPIRLFKRERERLRVWQNRRVEVVNAKVSTSRLQSSFDAVNACVLSLENTLFVYLAVRMVMSGQMTLGMITALIAYKQQFVSGAMNAIGRYLDYRLLDVQLARVSDIVLTSKDPSVSHDVSRDVRDSRIESISLRGVHVAYGHGDQEVLKGISIDINAGESVAITGPSGAGKSTLIKVLLGIVEPQRGALLINGLVVGRGAFGEYRSRIGAVMQDDILFAGTIAQNIAFFDSSQDDLAVEHAARVAQVHEDITAMPMGYQSLVGDMGSSLSGGQRQRVILARALYKQPTLLILDEATSHLDVGAEKAVNAALDEIGVTRVIVSHRPETIMAASRRIVLAGGKAFDEREILAGHHRSRVGQ